MIKLPEEPKPAVASVTIQASVASILGAVAVLVQLPVYTVDTILPPVGIIVSAVVAIWGRYRATRPVEGVTHVS